MRRFLARIFITAVAALAAGPSYAHAKLLGSTPAAESTTPAPSEIRLQFSERLEAKLSAIELTTEAGSKVATAPVVADPNDKMTIVAPISDRLGPGAYRVHWSVVSADMHKVDGNFIFHVGP
jgi:methionine-rich copper-binding protein CopC